MHEDTGGKREVSREGARHEGELEVPMVGNNRIVFLLRVLCVFVVPFCHAPFRSLSHELQAARACGPAAGTGRSGARLHVVPPGTVDLLARLLEIPRQHVDVAMGNDVRMTWVNNNYAMEGIVHERDGESHVDYWGIHWVKEGPFNQIAGFPLARASREEVLQYRFPVERTRGAAGTDGPGGGQRRRVLHRLRRLALRLRDVLAPARHGAGDARHGRRPGSGRGDVPPLRRFRGAAVGGGVQAVPLDWLWAGDDVAGQQSLMMSPPMWRRLIKPQLARVFAVGKRHGSGWPITAAGPCGRSSPT